jgi:hypothetical protein
MREIYDSYEGEKAEELSFRIAVELKKILDVPEKTSEKLELPGLHFTHTTRHKLNDLIQKLAIKNEKTKDEMLTSLNLDELRQLDITPKERAKRLIEELENRIDPKRKFIQKTILNLVNTFLVKGFKLQVDPLLENTKVSISFEAENNEDLLSKARALTELNLTPYQKLMKGELDVE